MQITSRALKAAAVVAAAGLALTACSSGTTDPASAPTAKGGLAIMNEGKLTICSDVPYPPFEFLDESGQTVGFDIDIANEIAADLEVELEILDDSFEGIQSGLSLNKCDISISSISITEERKGNMDFSAPYLADDLTLIASADSGITDLESAQGKRVGVQAGTTGEAYAKEQGLTTVGFEDAGLQLEAVKNGSVDAALGNVSVLAYGIKDSESLSRVADFETGEELGISIKKGNAEMKAAVDGTLKRLTDSGKLAELESKWFGEAE